MGTSVPWGRDVLPERKKPWLCCYIQPAGPCPPPPTRVDEHMLGDDCLAVPIRSARPHQRLPDSCRENPAAHHFLLSYLQNLKGDLLPCVSQGCVCKRVCAAEDQGGDPRRTATCWGLSGLGTSKWGFSHFTLAREEQHPPPLVSAVGFLSAHPKLPPALPALSNVHTRWIWLKCLFWPRRPGAAPGHLRLHQLLLYLGPWEEADLISSPGSGSLPAVWFWTSHVKLLQAQSTYL